MVSLHHDRDNGSFPALEFFTECLAGELGPIPGRRPVLRNRLYCAGTEKIEKMEEDTHESCNCDTEEGGGTFPESGRSVGI